MTKLVVENEHYKDIMHYNEIGLCAQNTDTLLGRIVIITIGRAYVVIQKEEENLHFDLGF